jgi:hypothetical protein
VSRDACDELATLLAPCENREALAIWPTAKRAVETAKLAADGVILNPPVHLLKGSNVHLARQ